jgi:hypothetical protein
MLEESTRQSLLKALDDLQKDLEKKSEKLKELEDIRNECEEIKFLIQQIRVQLGLEEPKVSGELKTEIQAITATGQASLSIIEEKPIKEGISEIFDEFKHPMDVNEIVAEFRKRGWKLSENHPQEVIRGALKRHPGLFTKVSRGNWKKIHRVARSFPTVEGGS